MRTWAPAALLGGFALLLLGGAGSDQTIDYDIVTNGTINGAAMVHLSADGRIGIDNRYQNQDKSRTLAITITLGADGVPTVIRRTGEAFAFAPIDESFTRDGDRATWHNRVEHGSSAAAAGRYYVPFGLTYGTGLARDGAAYEIGLLGAALLRAPGGRMALLPVGEARAAIVGETVIVQGTERRHLRLVSLAGTSLDPIYLWLDDDDRLFAGAGAIRRGWTDFDAELSGRAREVDERLVDAAVRRAGLPTTPSRLTIRDVAVFDARIGRLLPHRTVTIAGTQIVAVTAARTPVSGTIIDGRGKTLLPGLWDMHVHLQPREVLRQLAAGVTTVRDMGNNNDLLNRLDARVKAGKLPGPTILRAGFIDARSPAATYNGILVADAAAALAAVDHYAIAGFVQIKLYNAVHPEWIAAIAKATHRRGLRLSGHVPFGATVQQVAAGGYDEIQHFIYPMLSIAERPAASPLTFNTARAAQGFDPDAPATRNFVALMRARHVAIDMTLSVYEPLLTGRPGALSPVMATWADRLPAAMLRQATGGPLPTPADLNDAQFGATLAKAQALMRALHQGGVQLLAGTDQPWIGGLALPRELELMTAAGLTPADVLRITTFEAARTMKRDGTVGTIAPGMRADLLLVDGDPTRDIGRIRAVDRVIRGGIAYRPADLLAIGLPAPDAPR